MANWVEDQSFQYEVWTDPNRELAMAYGAADSSTQVLPDRVTVILDSDGRLVLEYLTGTSSFNHPQEVLDDCTLLFGP
jgi:peroxiredoxin